MYRAVTLCCLFFVALKPSFTKAMTEEQKQQVREHFEMIGVECITNNPITEDDINDLRNKKTPTGEGVPCFLACVMRKIGVLDDAGMLQKEEGLELARKVFDDEEELRNIADYLHSCSTVNSVSVGDGTKGCERAMLAFVCMKDNASKFGIDM